MVLVNVETGESALVHLVDWNLTDTQYSELGKLSRGPYKLYTMCGGRGVLNSKWLMDDKVSDFRKRFGECCGGEIVDFQDLKLDTGHFHWSMSYDTDMKLIKTYSRKDNKVREFDLNKISQ